MLRTLLIAAALILPLPALAQQPAPRETVNAIAGKIRDTYFSVEKGDAIARALESEAAKGKYDTLTDPRDLAAALSNRLRPEDAHFAVLWSADAPPSGPRPGPGAGPGPRPGVDPERVANYGFVRTEITPGNVGVIEMRFFADIDFDNPDDPARRAADAALAMVQNADAVIFDLRNNGGGSPGMVGYLASAFTKPDAKIYNVFHSRQGTEDESPAKFYAHPRLDTPLFILTSGRTGSAAEALPYTLQAAKRATIVGEASGGAANPGGTVRVPGGYNVFISSGSPVNPITGKNWEGTGVIPDVATPSADALRTAQAKALETIVAADPARTDASWMLAALQAKPAPAASLAAYAGAYGPLTVVVEGETLQLRRGRRPAIELSALGPDAFFVKSDPLIHITFERDGAGKVIAVEQRDPFGPGQRQRRDP